VGEDVSIPRSTQKSAEFTTIATPPDWRYNWPKFREASPDMSTLEQIEAAILTLPSDELRRLRQWFADMDYQRWDEQLEQDVADGKLDALAAEAIAEFNAGKCREI
jgi:hypothetical protein